MLLANTEIRLVTQCEIDEVAALQLEVFARPPPMPPLMPFLADMYAKQQAEVRLRMRVRLAAELKERVERGSNIFVVSLGKDACEIIGTVDLSSHEMELPTHSLCEGLYMSTLAVDPEYRNRGLGRALLGAVEAEAAKRGATGIYLHVEAANSGARALYESTGYAKQPDTPMHVAFTKAVTKVHLEPLLMFKRF